MDSSISKTLIAGFALAFALAGCGSEDTGKASSSPDVDSSDAVAEEPLDVPDASSDVSPNPAPDRDSSSPEETSDHSDTAPNLDGEQTRDTVDESGPADATDGDIGDDTTTSTDSSDASETETRDAEPSDPKAFVTTWKTDNKGKTSDTEIAIPTGSGTFDYDVDWDNDGEYDQKGLTGDATHEFSSPGTYTVQIRGKFPHIHFNDDLTGNLSTDARKLVSIDQWGSIQWGSMKEAFQGCTNLIINATDTPNLSNVKSMKAMFREAGSVVDSGGSMGAWDTSQITDMSWIFSRAKTFNGQINSWDTGQVTDMSAAFHRAESFDRSLGEWDVSQVRYMAGMLDRSGLSTANYDATLQGWSGQSLQNGVTLGARGLTFCDGAAAKADMIENSNWTIFDAGRSCGTP